MTVYEMPDGGVRMRTRHHVSVRARLASGCLARLKDAPKKTTLGAVWAMLVSDSAQIYPVGLTGRQTATAGLPQDLLVFPWGELSEVWGEPARLGVIPWGEPAKLLIKNLLSSNSLVG